ncbi:hypothetical protein VN12_19070 [Pirellula sp. SH-Sr6A]|uniref:hypothetical protein n=1 Tax=Pirellula sp. SH-Sr6A TaxID=1632865 RepID=UPI00078D1668|nr:hypothetical protein [Pirellula sp. SH-Sr6A]AMV34235.1 hypothetical protein VN12_19070 [Pirellula sp. SH-Sr6A]
MKSLCWMFSIVCLGFAGCGAPQPPNTGETVASLLAKADALDGQVDKVVHRCYVCNLGMDGKEKLAVKHAGYTAHLCSEGCKQEFAANADSIIAQTSIPTK